MGNDRDQAATRAAAETLRVVAAARSRAQPVPAPAAVPAAVAASAVDDVEPLPGAPTEAFDRWWHAQVGRVSAGVSPAALLLAYTDWVAHLGLAPSKQAELVQKAVRKSARLAMVLPKAALPDAPTCIEPQKGDLRFADPAWGRYPFNVISQSFLLTQQWWHNATTGVRGVSRHHEEVVHFIARQLLDMCSPSNFVATNPVVLRRTAETCGMNLWQGAMYWWDDWQRTQAGRPAAGTEAFVVGGNVAITPGKVVMRNAIAELIQYAPATPDVHAEPVLIVPAWIMKYYVLDLEQAQSLVRYLVDQGHTVFCLSWKNPTAADREVSMSDYLRMGLFDALDAIGAIVPDRRVHATGYCLGGTLLAIGAAAMARDDDHRLASVTLLAAQTDFTEPGEINLFIDDSEVSFLEDMMFDRGYLKSEQMAGAFQLLRSVDLIWSRAVRDYLMGERMPMNSLMAWNQDATRMPFRMHTQYLHRLFLSNDLAAARYLVDGQPVALHDVKVPVFCLGTETDHVAPWRSVYKLHQLTGTELTFVLTSGGHNAGVVSPPARTDRRHRVRVRRPGDKYLAPDQFFERVPVTPGSWWVTWSRWLAERSSGRIAPPTLGAPERGYPALDEAPGRYVHQR